MLKAADALHGAGYRRPRRQHVAHAVGGRGRPRRCAATRSWRWDVVDYTQATARPADGDRRALADRARADADDRRSPRARGAVRPRVQPGARRAGRAPWPRSRPISSTAGRPARWPRSPRRPRGCGVPYALDLEDFHSGERSAPAGELNVARGTRRAARAAGRRVPDRRQPDDRRRLRRKYGLRPLDHPQHVFAGPVASRRRPPEADRSRLLLVQPDARRRAADSRTSIRAAGRARRRPRSCICAARVRSPVPRRPARAAARRGAALTLDRARPGVARRHGGAGAAVRRWACPCEEPSAEPPPVPGNKIFTYLAAGVPVVLSRDAGAGAARRATRRRRARATSPATSPAWPNAVAPGRAIATLRRGARRAARAAADAALALGASGRSRRAARRGGARSVASRDDCAALRHR